MVAVTSTSTTLTDEKGRDYDKWDLNGHKRCLEIIKKEVDNCFFLNRLPQEDGTTKRVLVSDATKFNFGKNKLNLNYDISSLFFLRNNKNNKR